LIQQRQWHHQRTLEVVEEGEDEVAQAAAEVALEEEDLKSGLRMRQATHISEKVRSSPTPSSQHPNTQNLTVKKIKQDLIDRARIKKSFARTLKKEGLHSDRLGSASNATALGVRSSKPEPEDSEKGEESDDGDLLESDSGSEDGDDFEEDTELAALRRRDKGKGREEPQTTQPPRDSRPSSRGTASQAPGRRMTDNGYQNRRDTESATDRPTGTKSHPRNTPHPRSQEKDTPQQKADGPSLRELKREAYLGPAPSTLAPAHPSRTRKQIAKPKPQDTESKSTASKPGKNTRPGQTTQPRMGAGGQGGRRKDGRPNLNARIGVMLEQIQRGQ
jgi:hypothetical protein